MSTEVTRWTPPPDRDDVRGIVVEIVTPPTEASIGPIKIDLLKAALGVSFGDVLAGSIQSSRPEGGLVVHVVCVPRQQIIVPLPVGPVKLACFKGCLHLSVPTAFVDPIRARLRQRLADKTAGLTMKTDKEGTLRGVFLIPPFPGEVMRYDLPGDLGPIILRFP